jgi:hypothetical protein
MLVSGASAKSLSTHQLGPSSWRARGCVVAKLPGEWWLVYAGTNRPTFRDSLLGAKTWEIDLIDSLSCLITLLSSAASGSTRVPLPGETQVAVRACKVGYAAARGAAVISRVCLG